MENNYQENRISQLIKDANLSSEELAYLNQIMDEVSQCGISKTLESIVYSIYEEIPVSFYQFITDDNYMGKALKNSSTGELSLYKYWVDTGVNFFDKGKKYLELLLTGGTRLGKSFFAALCMSYKWYKVMCLKDPHAFYKLSVGTPVVAGFFNLTLDLAITGMYFLFNNFLSLSPWFQKHGYMAGTKNPVYTPYNPAFQVVIASAQQDDGFVGKNLYTVGMDEINFDKHKDITSDDMGKLMDLYINVQDRASGTFGTDYLLCLVSSKNTENGFLEQYIEKEKNKLDKYVVDEPQWVILKDKFNYTEKKFYVAIGDRYTKSRILDDNEDIDEIKKRQQVIEVPCGFDDKPTMLKEAFELDLERSIRNRAGIANVRDGKFFNLDRVTKCYKDYLINPFSNTVVELGFDDDSKIQDYVLLDKLPKLHREMPHYIHWDASYSDSGDATGLSMVVPVNVKKIRRLEEDDIKDIEDVMMKLVFAIAIKPKPGEKINFQKIRQFIYWLITDQKFNIVNVSMDSFQSADALQIMSQKGIKTELLSVDRTTEPYMSARNAINESRFIMPKISYLEDEFADVMLINGGKKIQHTKEGRKDLLDSVVANIFKINRSFQNKEIEVNASYILNMDRDRSKTTIEDAIKDGTFILGQGNSVVRPNNNVSPKGKNGLF